MKEHLPGTKPQWTLIQNSQSLLSFLLLTDIFVRHFYAFRLFEQNCVAREWQRLAQMWESFRWLSEMFIQNLLEVKAYSVTKS